VKINKLIIPNDEYGNIKLSKILYEDGNITKDYYTNKFDINYEKYESTRCWINRLRIKYKDILVKYKNDPEYQTIEKIQSVQQVIKKIIKNLMMI
jgi:hypothetical protein